MKRKKGRCLCMSVLVNGRIDVRDLATIAISQALHDLHAAGLEAATPCTGAAIGVIDYIHDKDDPALVVLLGVHADMTQRQLDAKLDPEVPILPSGTPIVYADKNTRQRDAEFVVRQLAARDMPRKRKAA